MNIYELIKWARKFCPKINDSFVRRIYRYEDGLLIELYKPGLKEKYLYILPGKFVCLHHDKVCTSVDKFVNKLRKDFLKKKVSFGIYDEERVFVVSRNDNSLKIYVELFGRCIIVVDQNDTILYASEYKDYGIRKIFKGEKYRTPPSKPIPKSYEDFREIINSSEKKDIVRCLAIDLRLGGQYAEWLLSETGIDKNKKPKELSEEEIRKLWDKFREFLENDLILYNGEWITVEEYNKRLCENIKKEEYNVEEKIKEVEKLIDIYRKIGDFLKTYAYIFEEYDVNKIKENLKELGIDAEVYEEGNNIIIKIKEEDLFRIVGS